MNSSGQSDRVVLLIGIGKLIKAVLFVVAAAGTLRMLHHDVAQEFSRWIDLMQIDPKGFYFHWVIEKLGLVNDRALAGISAGLFFYAAMLTIQGVGLCLNKRWAEYMTVIITGCYLPIEIYVLVTRFSALKAGLILLHVAVFCYLIYALRRPAKRQPAVATQAATPAA